MAPLVAAKENQAAAAVALAGQARARELQKALDEQRLASARSVRILETQLQVRGADSHLLTHQHSQYGLSKMLAVSCLS